MGRASNESGVVVGIGTVLGSASLARRPLSETEVSIFRLANELPTEAFPAIWAAMQYGTFGTVPLAAGVALARRRPRLAGALAVGGTTAWIAAKVAKRLVGRSRPSSIIDGVVQRGAADTGLGFPSGHAAVSTAITVVAWGDVPTGWRAPLIALTGLVPLGRMYVGAHLPLDVLGGSALGLAIGCAIRVATPPSRTR